MAVSADQRRALKLLAGSPDGCIMAIMLADGFKNVMLNGLVRDGLATTTPGNVRAGKQPIEVVRMMITDAGRLALDGH
jgi:hypothetical protein